MSLRITREDYYLPLPMGCEHVWAIRGSHEYYVPVDDTLVPEWVLEKLTEIGTRGAARGLVIEDNCMYAPDAETQEIGNRVVYSVRCGLTKKNGVPHLRLSHIEPVDFDLYWSANGVCQHETRNGDEMKKPTQIQMDVMFDRARKMLESHKIKEVDLSRMNPFLQAFVIPKSEDGRSVKSFANDWFHALGLLLDEDKMEVGMSNRYCSFEDDEKSYFVFFNHPAILDYPDDSPEGRCAYGVWNP